jgi:nudix-type nucleoside diphosphatase (YffH/AdpP family)
MFTEQPPDAACREVLEETGYTVRDLEHVSTFYLSPGGSSEQISLNLAGISDRDKVTDGGGLANEDEDIASVEMSLADALAQVRAGRIVDAEIIIALYSLHDRLNAC